MRPKQSQPMRQSLVNGRLVRRPVGGMSIAVLKEPVPLIGVQEKQTPTTSISAQVQRDVGQGINNMSAQDRINMAFKNMKVSGRPRQQGRGVRML